MAQQKKNRHNYFTTPRIVGSRDVASHNLGDQGIFGRGQRTDLEAADPRPPPNVNVVGAIILFWEYFPKLGDWTPKPSARTAPLSDSVKQLTHDWLRVKKVG